ncbi:MAG: 2Fe-2S iron-sulfur cluster-binding protein [Alphaproteobacteria bacterium]
MDRVDNVPAASINRPFTVYLARRRREITVAADQTLLQALHDEGINWYGSCLEGRCSNCLCRVISGPIDHRDSVFTEKERARGDRIITCVSRGVAGERLVLDL